MSRPFFVWHFFVRRFSSRIFSFSHFPGIAIFRPPSFHLAIFRMGIFSSELFFVCIFFVRIFFRLFIFSFYIFSSVHFFVRIFFRPCIFSSTQFFVHADFVCHFSSMPFFVPAFFVFAIFRTCILSFVHFFDHAVLSMNFLIYVLGVCGSGPHRPRGVGYTWSGRASRPSTAPIPSATTCDCGRSAARGGGAIGRPAGWSQCARGPGVSSGAGF